MGLLRGGLLAAVCAAGLCMAESPEPASDLPHSSGGILPTIRTPEPETGFDWNSTVKQSFLFLGIEHAFRPATEPQTRAGLKGPFWSDYARSVTDLRGWSDGDPFLVNYIGHPMEGAVAGFIAAQNDRNYLNVKFGLSPRYWKARLRDMAFSAAYSEQFEIGPLSEASIGNIQTVPGSRGVADHVITPTLGLGWMVAEDALDHHFVQRFETWTASPVPRALVRGFLNPARSFSNLMRLRLPWHRDTRPGVQE